MPNKPHPPRKNPAKQSTAASANANGEDTSFIVFSNSKDGKKSKNKPAGIDATAPEANKSGKGKKESTDVTIPEAPKKPDTRTLIGGASWTGKLPVNLLSEHCQRQKWERPEYTMTHTSSPSGFLSAVILRQKNSKTQEVTTLPPMKLPDEQKELGIRETAVEARHFAATYALYRIASGKNLHMTMPPQFRDLWKGEFLDMKKEAAGRGMGWLYESDPFAARDKREEEKRIAEKRSLERERRIEAEKKTDGGLSMAKGKGWSRAPKVDMGKRMRRDVEGLVRRRGLWNPRAISMSSHEKQHIVKEIASLGFRNAHAEEALEICKDKEEALEWLLIHVPEDDLPKWSLPENYSAGVTLASGDLQREGKLKRLTLAGYTMEVCDRALDACNGDEHAAAERLQRDLLQARVSSSGTATPVADTLEINGGDGDFWREEQTVVASIFGDRYREKDAKAHACSVVLELQIPKANKVTLHIRKPRSGYPTSLPILAIEARLPAYIRLSILMQALQYASEQLLGEQMLFGLVDWLETEMPRIVEDPGKLTSIASAIGTSPEESKRTMTVRQRSKRGPTQVALEPSAASDRYLSDWQAKQNESAQQKMNKARQGLPAWKLQEDIVEAVNDAQVTIISGETGSGKSTQSVQFILDDMIKRRLGAAANIICTQPRRISALGLADRVAEERCSRVGEEVGYAIRGESRQKQGVTRITFVTTGVLLRRLQTSGGRSEDVVSALADVTHVVIDEVHERSLDTDFLMVLLRNVLKVRKDLKLILMSATLDAQVFERYFAATSSVSKVEIAGRTHPVRDLYLDDVLGLTGFGSTPSGDVEDDTSEDRSGLGAAIRAVGTRINYDLIAETVSLIDHELGHQDGGILIFLPGVAEIDRTLRSLQSLHNIYALPLHASLQPAEQRRVFPPAPRGQRKVIAATNVAETSITIEDIVAVIDTGRVKETSFDPISNMVKLEEVWASRAACKQRRGRAGRVRAGTCYKLYTRSAEADKMAERPDPEIRRVPLEQLCLSVKAMGVADVPNFLASALTPPESIAVEGALHTLTRMGALDRDELTALGRHLSMIPADLRCGKLLVYGAAFGCLEACLGIASILSARSPFLSPQNKRDEAKAARADFSDTSGDLMCDLQAYQQWSSRRAAGEPPSSLRHWCSDNFLSHQTLSDISTNRSQYISSLQEIGFLPMGYRTSGPSTTATSSAYNAHDTNTVLVRALIAASFTPQIARIEFPDTKYIASVSGSVAQDPEARTIKFYTEDTSITDTKNARLFIHPSSTLFSAQAFPTNSTFMAFFVKMATSKIFMRELTPFNTYSALLFCGSLELDTDHGGLLIDRWIRVRGWARIGVLVSRLRAMLDDVLAKKIEDPGLDLGKDEVVGVVRRLVELDGLDR